MATSEDINLAIDSVSMSDSASAGRRPIGDGTYMPG